jgi:O-antigen/teichoic acid export membrane protein
MKKFKSLINNLHDQISGNAAKTKLIKSGMGSLIINFSNKFLVLLSGILLVRILGKTNYGVYSYILSLVFVFIIPVEFGLSNLIVRETAQGITERRNGSVLGIWQWSVKITFFLYTILITLSAVGLIWAAGHFSHEQITAYLWALSLIPFQALLMLSSAALRGLNHVILGQLADMIVLPGFFVAFFLVFHLVTPSLNTSTAMFLRSLSTLIAFIFSGVFLIKRIPNGLLKTKPVMQGRVWVASALPLGLSSGLGMVKTRITILLMAFFVSATQIGTFQVAISTSGIAGLVLQATNAVLAPQFASLFVQKRKSALQKLVTVNTRIVLVFNLIATILFILFGKQLLSIVFGTDLVDAYLPVLILLIGQLVNAFVGSVAFLLNMTGHEKDVMKVIIFSTMANGVITLTITPFWGIIGGAISTAFSLSIAQIIMAILVFKRLGIISHPFIKVSPIK